MVTAIQIDEPFRVKNGDNYIEGKASDYLMCDVDGSMYPCDAVVYEKYYEEIASDGPNET